MEANYAEIPPSFSLLRRPMVPFFMLNLTNVILNTNLTLNMGLLQLTHHLKHPFCKCWLDGSLLEHNVARGTPNVYHYLDLSFGSPRVLFVWSSPPQTGKTLLLQDLGVCEYLCSRCFSLNLQYIADMFVYLFTSVRMSQRNVMSNINSPQKVGKWPKI